MADALPSSIERSPSRAGGGPVARSRWLPYLNMVFLLQLALLLYLLPRDFVVRNWIEELKAPIYRAYKARQLAAMLQKDPKPGTIVVSEQDSVLRKAVRKANPNGQPTVLLFIGACSPCVERDLLAWQRAANEHKDRGVIVISRDSLEGVALFRRLHHCPLPILADPKGEFTERFNAFWVPRAYAVTPDGRLAWVQKNAEAVATTIRQAWQSKED
jgi:hypothetical protein